MKILHISDLHYRKNERTIIESLFQKMRNIIKEQNVEVVLFTGDLVDKFNCSYKEGYNFLEDNILSSIDGNAFFCCGNHDIDRNKISDLFKKYLLSIDDNDEIYQFIKNDRNNDFTNNIAHIAEYNSLMKSIIPKIKTYNELAYSSLNQIGGKNVAFVSLNFSWLAFEKDSNKIHFPEKLIYEIVKDIEDADFKILLSHHPLTILHERSQKNISQLIYTHFDCIFNGHTHQEEIYSYFSTSNGIFSCTSPSIMDQKNSNYPFGFSIFDINLQSYQVSIEKYEYIMSQKEIINILNDKIDIPVNQEKKKKIRIRSAILTKYDSIIDEANKKFIPSFNDDISFLELFTEPIIRKSNKKEIEIQNDKIIKSDSVKYRKLKTKENIIIFGKEKSGKSSLIYKLILDYINELDSEFVIPFYIDLKFEYGKKQDKFNTKKHLKNYYNLSNADVEWIFENVALKLFIDNYDFSKKEANRNIFTDIKQYTSISIFVTSVDNLIDGQQIYGFTNTKKLYIHDIKRSQIREITNKWPITANYDKDKIVEKITTLFRQLNIHFNFWTVSLFLWIFQRQNNINLHNNVELIDLYIENLLEKSNLILSSKSQIFSYDNYRDLLAVIAHFLFSEKEGNGYCCSYSELISCFETFKKDNIRIVATARECIEYILEKGIIIEKESDKFTYRLNGVFEYFLARKMIISEEFKTNIIENSSLFLSFKNELDIYSGFVRSDEELLIQIYFNTINSQVALKDKLEKIDIKQLEHQGDESSKFIDDLSELITELKEEVHPLTYTEQDQFEELMTDGYIIESEIKVKHKYDLKEIDAQIYLLHISILSRVFRNLDEVKDLKLINEIFSFIVNQSCFSLIYILEELLNEISNNKGELSELIEMKDFFKSFAPLFIHTYLFEELAHPNLENIILNKISDLKKNVEKNQLLLFIHYFLLIDIDPEYYQKHLEDLIETISDRKINYSIMIKLLLLITTKCHQKTSLEKILKKNIEIVYKKVYPERKRNAKDQINRLVKELDSITN